MLATVFGPVDPPILGRGSRIASFRYLITDI